jgi:hypothetical protein
MNSPRHERDVTPLYPDDLFLRATVATKDCDASPSLQTRNGSDASLPASLFLGSIEKIGIDGFSAKYGHGGVSNRDQRSRPLMPPITIQVSAWCGANKSRRVNSP